MPAKKKKKKKGSDLEEAVKLIHEAILRSDPQLRGTHFTVERNKILNVNGARHEIDVFAQTNPDSPYEATFIFECKDWAAPVGVEAVHVLRDKVSTLEATRGFLVARRITEGAQALLEATPNLRFIRCSSELEGPLNSAVLCHSVREPLARTVSLRFRGIEESKHPTKLDWQGKSCRLNDQEVDFQAIIEPYFDQLVDEDSKRKAAHYLQEGTHPSTISGRVDFKPEEFLFDGMEVEFVEIRGSYFITVTKRHPRFKFQLDRQGRAIAFEPILDFPSGATIEIQAVQRV